ncbi:MAG: DUF1353 domain-containing protein [Xanthobacteraceae bacterium]
MMKRLFGFAVLFLVLSSAEGRSQFMGKFELGPQGCERTGICVLTYDFQYRDPNGLVWQAAASNKTDGASIPPWATPFIGQPFDKMFIKAAAIHDHYCVRHVRSWRLTHRVFYDALIEQGVSQAKAKLMYYAVYLGGPKWAELIAGKGCGKNCIFKIEEPVAGVSFAGAKQFITRGPTYGEPGFAAELKAVEKLIEEGGDTATLEFLERRAADKKPGDTFYKSGDQIVVSGGLAIE